MTSCSSREVVFGGIDRGSGDSSGLWPSESARRPWRMTWNGYGPQRLPHSSLPDVGHGRMGEILDTQEQVRYYVCRKQGWQSCMADIGRKI